MLMHALHGNHGEHQATATNANESLLETLRVKRRHALGEISNAQFEQMKRALELPSSPQANTPTEHASHSAI